MISRFLLKWQPPGQPALKRPSRKDDKECHILSDQFFMVKTDVV